MSDLQKFATYKTRNVYFFFVQKFTMNFSILQV